mmetsp:Transcript_33595/g.70652  ORF Transcript_33595/g.70652 Transcript_33595/m.70652 type:complete len:297 (-) Transcript_33595:471-1361(-)
MHSLLFEAPAGSFEPLFASSSALVASFLSPSSTFSSGRLLIGPISFSFDALRPAVTSIKFIISFSVAFAHDLVGREASTAAIAATTGGVLAMSEEARRICEGPVGSICVSPAYNDQPSVPDPVVTSVSPVPSTCSSSDSSSAHAAPSSLASFSSYSLYTNGADSWFCCAADGCFASHFASSITIWSLSSGPIQLVSFASSLHGSDLLCFMADACFPSFSITPLPVSMVLFATAAPLSLDFSSLESLFSNGVDFSGCSQVGFGCSVDASLFVIISSLTSLASLLPSLHSGKGALLGC